VFAKAQYDGRSSGVHSLRSAFQTEFLVCHSAILRGFKMAAKTQSTLLGEHMAGNKENSTIIRIESTVFLDFPDSMTASSGTTVIEIRDFQSPIRCVSKHKTATRHSCTEYAVSHCEKVHGEYA
jgi:hypothetical protein